MKKIALLIIKIILKFLRLIKWLVDSLIYYFDILKNYLNGQECTKLKDCLMLAKFKAGQPPASDRYIEYPWLLENINLKSGRLLDIGSTIGDLLSGSLPQDVEIHCLNLNDKKFNSREIKFKKGDIRQSGYPDNYFDLISCISTLEHIGVAGRYGCDEDPAGDFKAMAEIKRILKPGGELLLSVPYGASDVLPINKLYNKTRIENLFSGWEIISQELRKFSKTWRVWLKVDEAEAAKVDMKKDGWYALCLIKAHKSEK